MANRLLRSILHRRRVERELDKEIQFHVDQSVDDLVATGLSVDEARRRTRLEFGGTQQIKEQVREASLLAVLDTFWADVRYAGRALRRSPGFAASAMIALALGSGGTTALATILNDLILRPPRMFRDSHELILVGEISPQDPSVIREVAPAVYAQWRSARALERVAAIRDVPLVVNVDGDFESATGQAISADLLDMLGTAPILGRGFAPDDDRPEAAPVALISYGYWQRRFAGANDILQRRVGIAGRSHAIVGVLPREYALAYGANMFLPLPRDLQPPRENAELFVVARLRDGADPDQVRAELGRLQRVAEQTMVNREPGWGVRVDPMRGRTGLGGRGMALVFPLFFAASLLTLIATSLNLAILMVARGMARVKEAAIRAALGASRYRLMQQVLLEAILVAAGGGLMGLVVAVALSRYLISSSPGAVPPEFAVGLDLQVFGLAALVVIVAGVAAGAAPALAAARTDVTDTLKGVVLPGRRPRHLRSVLVVAEFGIAMMFLVGVGLFIHGYSRALDFDPGFEWSNLLTVRLDEGPSGQASNAVTEREAVERLLAVPGVASATVSSIIPPFRGGFRRRFSISRGATSIEGTATVADVDPSFFRTIGLATLRGRTFDAADPSSSGQVVVSDGVARRYWPLVDPLGQFIQIAGNARVYQIVGVVGDIHRRSDTDRGLVPYLYRLRAEGMGAGAESGRAATYVIARAQTAVAGLTSQVQDALREVRPDRPVAMPVTLAEMINRGANELLLVAFMLSPMVLLTLILSTAGIYGLTAQMVATRTRELGIRAALGAGRVQLVSLILRDGLRMARAGLVVGVAGVVAINRVVMSVFVDITWAEPWVVLVSALLMVVVALAASFHPAYRAARVDPMTALRYE